MGCICTYIYTNEPKVGICRQRGASAPPARQSALKLPPPGASAPSIHLHLVLSVSMAPMFTSTDNGSASPVSAGLARALFSSTYTVVAPFGYGGGEEEEEELYGVVVPAAPAAGLHAVPLPAAAPVVHNRQGGGGAGGRGRRDSTSAVHRSRRFLALIAAVFPNVNLSVSETDGLTPTQVQQSLLDNNKWSAPVCKAKIKKLVADNQEFADTLYRALDRKVALFWLVEYMHWVRAGNAAGNVYINLNDFMQEIGMCVLVDGDRTHTTRVTDRARLNELLRLSTEQVQAPLDSVQPEVPANPVPDLALHVRTFDDAELERTLDMLLLPTTLPDSTLPDFPFDAELPDSTLPDFTLDAELVELLLPAQSELPHSTQLEHLPGAQPHEPLPHAQLDGMELDDMEWCVDDIGEVLFD